MATTSTGRLLTDKQLGEAVTRGIINHQKGKTDWQAISEDQDVSTLKAVGEWLDSVLTTTNTHVSMLTAIVNGIIDLQEGKMPGDNND